MESLAQQRCFHHARREAVARCPQCSRFFCRECVTEHENRLLCASCLQKLAEPGARGRNRLRVLATAAQCVVGFMVLWLYFYGMGRMLLRLPSSFHEGTLWQGDLTGEP